MIGRAEYIWIDGEKPSQKLRSKTRFLQFNETTTLNDFPEWSFDGSSTYQAIGHSSDLILQPVNFFPCPIHGKNNFLVLCEVFDADGKPHTSNKRAKLRNVLAKFDKKFEPWVGFEQEYTLFNGNTPLGWPIDGYPRPQGPFYCGVGADKIFGRTIADNHATACMNAGLAVYGTNAEVMPGQWEFQIGYRGFKDENFNALDYADHLWLARWLLNRIAEESKVIVSFDNKPVKGDWNGAGCHTNFSTKQMRVKKTGFQAIEDAVEALSGKHAEHIKVYGAGLSERLTGLHETCSIERFAYGIADRGASVRIPQHVQAKGYGYIEDRRPGANCCPYQVTAKLVDTICAAADATGVKKNQEVA